MKLEHVPKKLRDFFDQNMLQLFESERFLFDQMISSDREALLGFAARLSYCLQRTFAPSSLLNNLAVC